jgi:ATP-dependent DNA ligase
LYVARRAEGEQRPRCATRGAHSHIKADGEVRLRSRNDKDFSRKYPMIAKALATIPDETVIDGEVVALDPDERPSFNALQNHAAHAIIIRSTFFCDQTKWSHR